MVYPADEPRDPIDAADLRRELAAADEDEGRHTPSCAPITRDEAVLRLVDRLPPEAFASIMLTEVALATADQAADLRAGKPARFSREWAVLITAPGYQHNHSGDELDAVVEQALNDYFWWREQKDAADWVRTAIPDAKPPKLLAPGTADERRDDHEKDAG